MKRRKYVVDLVKAAFIVLIVKVMASTSEIMPWGPLWDNACVLFSIFVLLIKLSRLTLPLGKAAVLLAISLFTLYTCIAIRQYELLITLITICLLINTDLDEYISLMFKVEVFILAIHVAVSVIWSLIGDHTLVWKTIEGRLRFKGGFLHPNVLSCYIMSCMLMFTWKRFGRITANEFAYMAIVAAITYLMTASRTGLLLNIILLLIIILTQSERWLVEKTVGRLLLPLFPALSAFVYWVQRRYMSGNVIILFLDRLLTGRLRYASYGYTRSGITWLPRYLDYAAKGLVAWTPEWNLNTFAFDNIYSFLIVQVGIVWIGIITAIIAVVCRKTDYKTKIFFLIWVLFGMVEVHGLNCFKFFPPILLSMLLSKKGAGNEPNRNH